MAKHSEQATAGHAPVPGRAIRAGQSGQGNQGRAIRADRAVGSVRSKSTHLVLGKQQLEVWMVHI